VDLRALPPARLSPTQLPLMLPTLVAEVPTGPGWLFEIKWDGVRVLILRRDGAVTLLSRTQEDVTARYPEITAATAPLPDGDLALDAEIVALDEHGRPSFHRLQHRMHLTRNVAATAQREPVTAHAFDCLVLDGRDLRGVPLRTRKALLRDLLPGAGALRFCDHVDGDGVAFLAAACALGLEGVVAKRADSRYRGGRRPEWRKVKCFRCQEFVIGGYTDPRGTRAHLGAMHLGLYEDGVLTYVGRVGSSLPAAELAALSRRLRALATERCPFARGTPPRGPENHWVRPALVCAVRFGEWTRDGSIRHPVFLGLRADRDPRAVCREEPRRL